jgi:CHAT domain-containing protein
VPSVKLAYASAKTIVKINNEIRDLEMIQAPDEDFRAFQSVLEEVKKKWARKRKNGEPATKIDRIGNQSVEVYDIPVEDLKSYQDEAEELELQFKSVIDTQRVKEKNYLDIQNEPSKVQFHLVEMSEVKHLLDKKKEGPGRLTGPQFLAMAFLLKKPVIKMDMIPDDVTQADMMALVEYFEL